MYFINYLKFGDMFLCAPSLVSLSHLCRVSRAPCVVVSRGGGGIARDDFSALWSYRGWIKLVKIVLYCISAIKRTVWSEGLEKYQQTCRTFRDDPSTCSGGRIISWIIYCWLVWCERKILFPAGNLQSFTSKRTDRNLMQRFLRKINPKYK